MTIVNMKDEKITSLCETEKLRDICAKNNNPLLFKKLYAENYVDFSNLNTGSIWDKLNRETYSHLNKSSIYKDKIKIVIHLLSQGNGNLLDIGFGNGIIERKLDKSNYRLFGIDISQKSTIVLNKANLGIFKVSGILKIPFESNFFDYVLVLDVLEHVSPQNTFKALSEVKRVLKKGGNLIISIPLNEGLDNLLKTNRNVNMHVREYTSEILKAELKYSGFLVRKEYFLYAYEKCYRIKKILTEILFRKFKNPNLYICLSKKI